MKTLSLILFVFLSSTAFAQYEAPALPTELSEKIQNYLDIGAPGAGKLDAGGKRLFFNWNVTGTRQIWRLDGPNAFPVQLTGGELTTVPYDVTPDGKWLIIGRDRGGEENPGLYLMDPKGGPARVIKHKPRVQTRFQFVTKDSAWIYYVSNDQRPDAYAIYRYALADGKTEVVFNEPGLWSIEDHQDDGTLLLKKSTGSMSHEIYEWSPATRQARPLFGQGQSNAYQTAYGFHPGEIIVATQAMKDFAEIYSWRDGKFTVIGANLPWDKMSPALDPQRKTIFYNVNENGYQRLYAIDAATYLPRPLPPFPDADHVRLASFDPSGRYAMLSVSLTSAPPVNYSYDLQTDQLTQWGKPSSPEMDASQFTTAELSHYPARDGTKIPMLVRRPPACRQKLCPVLVSFHGGPEGQASPGFSPMMQAYLDDGFVIVEPNVRGSSGYGRAWLDADNKGKRLEVLTDIADAGLYIKNNWQVDGVSPKVGVLGGSYGGYATNVAMTIFAGVYDAGSAVVGMSNLITFIENTAPYRRLLRMNEYGNPAVDREVMEKLSPLFHVDKIVGPLQLIQGANDPRVPVSEAVQMLERMREKNIPGSLIVFPDEGHGFVKRSNRVLFLGNQLLFFRKHLR